MPTSAAPSSTPSTRPRATRRRRDPAHRQRQGLLRRHGPGRNRRRARHRGDQRRSTSSSSPSAPASEAARSPASTARPWAAAPGWSPTATSRSPSPDATFGLTEIRLGLWPFLVFAPSSRRSGRAPHPGTLAHRTHLSRREARELGLVHEVADDAAGARPGNRPRGGRVQPHRHPERLSFVNQVRGLDLDSGRRHRPRGPGRRLRRRRFPRGHPRFPGEAAAPLAVARGVSGMPQLATHLRICDTTSCGVANRYTGCWGERCFTFAPSAFSIVTTPPSQARLKLC